MANRSRLFIVDGNGYIYRAFFALPPLTNSAGEPTNAIFGFIKMIFRLLADARPDFFVITFDSKEKNWRAREFEAYKAHRPPMPAELPSQIDAVKEFVTALKIPQLECPGWEADDIIAALTHTNQDHYDIHIVTGDKDLMQLVQPNVWINDTMKNVEYDRAGVFGKMGVYPEQIIDLLALMGDTADNIPGVPGVGPKTAAKLLAQYSTLDNIYEHLSELTPGLKQKLLEHREEAYVSQRLACLSTDMDLPVDLSEMHLKIPDWSALETLFKRYELHSLWRDIQTRGWRVTPQEAVRPSGEVVDEARQEAIDVARDIFEAPDLETIEKQIVEDPPAAAADQLKMF